MERWLGGVNQPVVDDACFIIDNLLEDISDGGNFNIDECKQILIEIIIAKP